MGSPVHEAEVKETATVDLEAALDKHYEDCRHGSIGIWREKEGDEVMGCCDSCGLTFTKAELEQQMEIMPARPEKVDA